MAVRVGCDEIEAMGKPLSQCRLQAVVVGPSIIYYFVDELQIRELGGVWLRAGGRIDLIDIDNTQQIIAVIADITDVQTEVVSKSVLHTKIPTRDEGGFEVGIQSAQAARRGGGATERQSTRKNNTIPVERRAGNPDIAPQQRTAKSLWTRGSDGYRRCAATGRDGGDTTCRGVWSAPICEIIQRIQGVKDTDSAPDHRGTLTRQVPGKTHAR